MPKFRKKPVEVEAVQLSASPGAKGRTIILEWEDVEKQFPGIHAIGNNENGRFECICFNIDTLEGTMTALPGDWIITGIKGECYPCKPDIFAATYDPVV